MISILDAIVLARAKLKSKRILLFTAISLSVALFGILFAIVMSLTGLDKSLSSFLKDINSGTYYVKVEPSIPYDKLIPESFQPSEETVDKVTLYHKEYIAKQKQLSKALGIKYDETQEQSPFTPNPYADSSLPEKRRVTINMQSPAFERLIFEAQENYAKNAKNTLDDLRVIANRFSYKSISNIDSLPLSTYSGSIYLKNGTEDLRSGLKPFSTGSSIDDVITSSVSQSSYTLIDDGLVKNFVLPLNEKRKSAKEVIPVVITDVEAAKLFGKKFNIPEVSDFNLSQLDWTNKLRENLNGETYTVCQRNNAETELINKIIQTAGEIEKNKSNKDYVKPSIIYRLPESPCGEITVEKDTRTLAEKQIEEKNKQYAKALGSYQEPRHKLLKFQIVGIMPFVSQMEGVGKTQDLIKRLVSPSYGFVGAIVPAQMYGSLSENAKPFAEDDTSKAIVNNDIFNKYNIRTSVVGFSSIDDARNFINELSCRNKGCESIFKTEPYVSNYLLLDDFGNLARQAIIYSFILAFALSVIVLLFTIARIVIDSRRETAVFRAIGAKRSDIVKVYIIYSLFVSAIVLVSSVITGIIIALVIDLTYGQILTNELKSLYTLYDLSVKIKLIGWDMHHMLLLVSIIVISSLLALITPLWRNVRRNPLSDMRNE